MTADPAGAISPMTAKKSTGLRIPVVEDEPLIRWSIGEALTDAGHAITGAPDGATALQAIAANSYDVVLLDLRLPDSNDLTLLATIGRRAPRSAVVLMTAFGAAEIVTAARTLGARRVLAKPFDLDDMTQAVITASAA